MTKLNDMQLVILNRAAQRDDHGVATIDKRAATRDAIEALLKQKLLKTVVKTSDLALWTRGDDGPLGLALTPKGLKALALDEPTGAEAETEPVARLRKPARKAKPTEGSTASEAPAPSRGNKTEIVLALLRRPNGVALAEVMEATGWQAHSVRGFLSGTVKTRLGLTLSSETQGKTRFYRIEG